MKTDTGGPAKDKTLLDENAQEAMNQFCSRGYFPKNRKKSKKRKAATCYEIVAFWSYQMAEAMIAEKQRREE